ncbi:MAG TPA: diguanylate cyclase [Longimicrobium sp.]|nr:diguanylate cyclase [Longimicrobium sp.]
MKSPLLAIAAVLVASAPLAAQARGNAAARALVVQAERLQEDEGERALRLIDRALPMLRAPEDRPLRLRALAAQCWAAAGLAEPAEQVAMAERGMAEALTAGDPRTYASLRTCRGYGHDAASRTALAAADYDFAIAEGRRLHDPPLLATALMFRGEQRYYRGELGDALEELNEAYAIYARLRNASRTRYTLNAIANLYADERVAQYDRAIEYYRQVLASHQALGSRAGIATAFYNLGSTLERKGDLEAALSYYHRALDLERRLDDAGDVAECQRAVGVVLGKLGRPAEAMRSLEDALAYFQRTGAADATARTRLSRGVALRGLGRTAEALGDLDAARAWFTARGNERFLERVEAERALALAALGDWQRAYEASAAQTRLQTALNARLREETTSRLRVQFDSEKKEQENRALVRENALRGRALRDAERIRWLQTAVIVLTLAVIATLGYLVVRHILNARMLRTLALTDELTRLPNRRHLLHIAEARVDGARQGTGPLSVLALDVDHFKRINDTFGHEAGDRVLQRVAAACRAAIRHDDVIGRTGGEEFVVLMPGADGKVAVEVAERLRGAVERVDWSELDPELRVTVSVGAAQWTPGDDGFADMARRADDSLYRAKAGGRNRTELAAPSESNEGILVRRGSGSSRS